MTIILSHTFFDGELYYSLIEKSQHGVPSPLRIIKSSDFQGEKSIITEYWEKYNEKQQKMKEQQQQQPSSLTNESEHILKNTKFTQNSQIQEKNKERENITTLDIQTPSSQNLLPLIVLESSDKNKQTTPNKPELAQLQAQDIVNFAQKQALPSQSNTQQKPAELNQQQKAPQHPQQQKTPQVNQQQRVVVDIPRQQVAQLTQQQKTAEKSPPKKQAQISLRQICLPCFNALNSSEKAPKTSIKQNQIQHSPVLIEESLNQPASNINVSTSLQQKQNTPNATTHQVPSSNVLQSTVQTNQTQSDTNMNQVYQYAVPSKAIPSGSSLNQMYQVQPKPSNHNPILPEQINSTLPSTFGQQTQLLDSKQGSQKNQLTTQVASIPHSQIRQNLQQTSKDQLQQRIQQFNQARIQLFNIVQMRQLNQTQAQQRIQQTNPTQIQQRIQQPTHPVHSNKQKAQFYESRFAVDYSMYLINLNKQCIVNDSIQEEFFMSIKEKSQKPPVPLNGVVKRKHLLDESTVLSCELNSCQDTLILFDSLVSSITPNFIRRVFPECTTYNSE